ncbi:MAG: hypothetical protein E7553_06680 [Ruminococcaceae bacterium]|nr:hypothetical protein [Oscillospiraceae bacterium]
MTEIIVAIITGGLALVGVVISNVISNRQVSAQLEKAQAVTDMQIKELTREVREHNGFAKRMPVVEEKIATLTREVQELKKFHQQ